MSNVEIGIRFTADGKAFVGEIAKSEAALNNFGKSGRKSGEEAAGGMKQATSEAVQLNDAMKKVGQYAAGYFGVTQVLSFAGALSDASLAADRLNNTLKFSTGSARAGADALEYVRQTANRLGTDLAASGSAFAKFSASAQGTRLGMGDVKAVFESVSKASSVLGLRAEETNGAMLALSQMMSKGTVQAEELRGQLGERIPGAFNIAARAMGVTTAELGKMLEQGQVISEDFLPKFAAEMEKTFGAAAGDAANSAIANVNRLNNAWEQFKRDLGQASNMAGRPQWLIDGLDESSATMRAATADGHALLGVLAAIGGFGFGAAGAGKFSEEAKKQRIIAVQEEISALKNQPKFTLDIGHETADLERIKELQKELQGLFAQGSFKLPATDELKAQAAAQTESIRKNLEASTHFSAAWTEADRNQAQKKAGKVAELDALHAAEALRFKGNQEMLLKLAEGYAEKRAHIDEQFAEKAKADPVAEAAKKAVADELKSYDQLIRASDDRLAALRAEAGETGKLSESEKKLAVFNDQVAKGTSGLAAEHIAGARAKLESVAAAEKLNESHQAELKAASDLTAELNKSVAADRKSLDAMTRKNDLLEKGIVSVESMALAELQLQYAALDTAAAQGEVGIALQKRIDIAAKMVEQAARGEHIKGLADEAKAASKAWEKNCEEINRSLTDALMRGWENGKGFAANFRDTVKNMFKTLVLQPTISAILSPVSAAVSAGMGALGIPGMANAAGMGSDLLGIGSSIAGFGASVATGFSLTAEAATTAASAYSAAGMGATSFGLQLGNLAAAIPGWGWAIAGGLALFSAFGGNKGTPTSSTGHAVIDYNAAGAQTGYQSQYGVQNATTDSFVAGMQANYMRAAQELGIGMVGTQFGYATNTGKDGKQPNFGLSGGGFVQGETAYSDAAVSLAAQRAVFAALQGSELPGYLSKVFDGLDAAKMSGQDIGNTLAFAASLKSVRTGLTETITPISAAQKALDGIGTTAATFTADFVKAIDKGMTPEKLAQWQTAGAALGQLGDMSLTIKAAVPQLTQTTWEMWNTQTNSVRGLIGTFDGSVAATYALSAATKERYATEQQLVNQISGAMGNLHTMFAGSSEQMRLSVMDSQQKQTYYVNQANALEAQLRAATDPAKIEDLARRLNDAENNAWQNLDDTQRKAMLESYTKNFDAIDALVQEKLGKTLDEVTRTSGTDLPAQIKDAVAAAMKEAAQAQKDAAASMQGAANTMQAAADKPTKIQADINFTANVPGNSQVAIL